MKTKKDIRETPRYQGLVALLAGLKPPPQKKALLEEFVKGTSWRINAALEASAKTEWKDADKAEILNWAAMFGRLHAVETLARRFGFQKDAAEAPAPVQAAYRTALLHGHYRTARALAAFGARPDALAVETPAAKEEPQPLPAVTDEQLKKTPFTVNFETQHLPVLKDAWGVPDIDPALKAALGGVKKTAEGLDLALANGHHIQWNANISGTEFIGNKDRNPDFNTDDARAVVAASKSRGWNAINVHGDARQKESLWLEAQRQGVQVANFSPAEDSEARRIWAREQSARAAKPQGKGPGLAA